MIFKNLNQQEIITLKKTTRIKTKELLRGEALYYENDLCSSIAIVKRGVIKASKAFSDGHEKIIRIINQNEIIGLSLIFSSNPFYKATFYAETLSTVEIINKDDLLKLMENEQIKLNILSLISDYSNKQSEHIRLLSYKTIKQKLCAFLYTEYKRTNATSFLIQYTKTELAALLNVERPSLSFELSKLQSEGIIANQNKLYTIIKLNELIKYI